MLVGRFAPQSLTDISHVTGSWDVMCLYGEGGGRVVSYGEDRVLNWPPGNGGRGSNYVPDSVYY
jgi:hypothetical protein